MNNAPGTQADKRASSLARVADSLLARLGRVTSSGTLIPEVDGLRFIAISAVVVLHVNTYVWSKLPVEFASSAVSDAARYVALRGGVGVRLFFAISGFLLTLPFAQARLTRRDTPSLKRYYLRRLSRLEPPYIINMTLVLSLLLLSQKGSIDALMPHFWASLFYVHDLIYGAPSLINAVAWSLEVEVQYYLLAPLLCMVFSLRSTLLRRAIIAAATAGTVALQPHLHMFAYPKGLIVGQLQYFLVGMLLADMYLVTWSSTPRRTWGWDIAALPAWLLIPFALSFPGPSGYYLPVAILIAYIGAFRGIVSGMVLRNRWLVAIGGMCYTIYLYHCFAISALGGMTARLVVTDLYWVNLLVQLLVIGLPLLVVCAGLYLLFEKPFMHRDWVSRWTGSVRRVLQR